jgi:hypothetical protein
MQGTGRHGGASMIERRPSRPGVARALLAFIGSVLSCVWLTGAFGFLTCLVAGFILTGLWWYGHAPRIEETKRSRRRIARTLSAGYHIMALYIALALGWLLAWTTPAWLRVVTAGLLLLAAMPRTWARLGRLRVPAILPLGLWITACLLGWLREDGAIRCDDYRRALTQAGFGLSIPSSPDLAACRAGEVLRVQRYPRRIWESSDQRRWVITTQEGIGRFHAVGLPVKSTFTGSICATDAVGAAAVQCLGEGKAQAVLEDPDRGTVFVAAWGQQTPGYWGVLYELPLGGTWRVLRERRYKQNLGEGYLDPTFDVMGFAIDEGGEIVMVRPSTLERLPSVRYDLIPVDTHYDPSRHEGVFCGSGQPFSGLLGLGVAFRGWPLVARPLGRSYRAPWSLIGIPEGCDWDPETRRVYVAVSNLGLLSTVGYDTGDYLGTTFVGPGVRTVAYDAPRHRVYVANFLRGDLIAIDAETGRRLHRWFVGRFVRFLFLSRDGTALFASSNLGVVRVSID